MNRRHRVGLLAGALLALGLASGCRQDMHDQPRYEPLEATDFFADRRASREPPPGTVGRGLLKTDSLTYRGSVDGEPATRYPFQLTAQILDRGRERYEIFCSPCHGLSGYGDGMVVRRGMKQPTSFHIDRLRQAPHGYLFDVITNGFGAMFPYGSRIPALDRWAIIAHVRALQLSQNASPDDVPEGVSIEERSP